MGSPHFQHRNWPMEHPWKRGRPRHCHTLQEIRASFHAVDDQRCTWRWSFVEARGIWSERWVNTEDKSFGGPSNHSRAQDRELGGGGSGHEQKNLLVYKLTAGVRCIKYIWFGCITGTISLWIRFNFLLVDVVVKRCFVIMRPSLLFWRLGSNLFSGWRK